MTNKTLRKEFIQFYKDLDCADDFIPSKEDIVVDWWLSKIEEVINDIPETITGQIVPHGKRKAINSSELKQQLRLKWLGK